MHTQSKSFKTLKAKRSESLLILPFFPFLFNLFYKLLNCYSPKRMKKQYHQAFFHLKVKTYNVSKHMAQTSNESTTCDRGNLAPTGVSGTALLNKVGPVPSPLHAMFCIPHTNWVYWLSSPLSSTPQLPLPLTSKILLLYAAVTVLVSSGFRNSSTSVQLAYLVNKFTAM